MSSSPQNFYNASDFIPLATPIGWTPLLMRTQDLLSRSTQWRIQKFWKGAEDNSSAPSSFIANAHNEIYAFYTDKWLFEKKYMSQWGGGQSPQPRPPWILHWVNLVSWLGCHKRRFVPGSFFLVWVRCVIPVCVFSCLLVSSLSSIVSLSWLCIMHRQPTPDPWGSCTGSQLSIISWHLNLTLTLL